MKRVLFLAPPAGALLLAASLAGFPASGGAEEPRLATDVERDHTLLSDHQYAIRVSSDRPVRDLDEKYLLRVEPSSPLDAAGFAADGTLVERGLPVEVWLTIDGVEAHAFADLGGGRFEWTYPGHGFLPVGPDYRVRVRFETSAGPRTVSTGFLHPG